MQHFINVDPAMIGTKDPSTKMMKCTLHLIADQNSEVQQMAMQALSAMLAFSARDITPFTRKLIDELVKCESILKGRARQHYYECIGHVVGRLGVGIDPKDLKRLLEPIMAEWRSHGHHSNETQREQTLLMCQSLCVVAMYSKDLFEPYNLDIINKIAPYLKSGGSNGHGDLKSEAVSNYLVAYLDLMSALVEGQGQNAASSLIDNGILGCIIGMLEDKRYVLQAQQSALALLGHICTNSYTQVHARIDNILKVLPRYLENHNGETGVANNAVWALSAIVQHTPEMHEKILNTAVQAADFDDSQTILNLYAPTILTAEG